MPAPGDRQRRGGYDSNNDGLKGDEDGLRRQARQPGFRASAARATGCLISLQIIDLWILWFLSSSASKA